MSRIQRIIYRKRLLLRWAKANGVKAGSRFRLNGVMGPSARRLLFAFQVWASLPATGEWNTLTIQALEKAVRARRVNETQWAWDGTLSPKGRKAQRIIYHHAAASSASAATIHTMHLARGFTGIGYHYYVRKDGSIWRGRPEWAKGAHAEGYNDDIGICCEGNFDTERMGADQLAALRWLRGDVRRRNGKLADVRHRDVNATACPGRNFPWAKVTA